MRNPFGTPTQGAAHCRLWQCSGAGGNRGSQKRTPRTKIQKPPTFFFASEVLTKQPIATLRFSTSGSSTRPRGTVISVLNNSIRRGGGGSARHKSPPPFPSPIPRGGLQSTKAASDSQHPPERLALFLSLFFSPKLRREKNRLPPL